MLHLFNKLTGWASSRKGAKLVLAIWLIAIVILSGVAPAAKKYAISAGEGSIHENIPSTVAKQVMDKHFPSEDGPAALVVFHRPNGIGEDGRAKIADFSKWLSSPDKPEHVAGVLPFHELPTGDQDRLYSEDRTTMLYSFSLKKGLDSDQVYKTIEEVRSWLDQNRLDIMQADITGPAGIASDTLALFKNADLVLIFATIGLILVLLIAIYRSPLLALIPLVAAGLVYQTVDRLIGLAGLKGWFVIDRQALSIMLILLFAVLTDYCLFVFSRYREQLKRNVNQYAAMRAAMAQVGEPILFSGGTVLIAMLTLFAAIFKPYHHFAPVFAVAMVVILLGGLTLLPAIFALLGRKAFWPFTPKLEQNEPIERTGMWGKIAAAVVKRPAAFAGVFLVLLLISSINIVNMKYSFNLLKSFPEHLSSRQGFERMEQKFPVGKLAPVYVILTSDQKIELDDEFLSKWTVLTAAIQKTDGVYSLSPSLSADMANAPANLPRNFLAKDLHALKIEVNLADNPYEQKALQTIEALRQNSARQLHDSGFGGGQYQLHYAGPTAEQLDVRKMNSRDTVVLFSLIGLFITMMLMLQTRSFKMALLMITTILLSYTATLGLSWGVFHSMLGYDAVSYRIPVYSFVFLVALGVDYNIMLVSRIREEARQAEWKEAVRRGVAHTGGVISSAGIILAATFAVLITQPMQELFLFGIMMAVGILLDTFLVRGILLPALLTFFGRKKAH